MPPVAMPQVSFGLDIYLLCSHCIGKLWEGRLPKIPQRIVYGDDMMIKMMMMTMTNGVGSFEYMKGRVVKKERVKDTDFEIGRTGLCHLVGKVNAGLY